MQACICVYMYVCMYVRMYVCRRNLSHTIIHLQIKTTKFRGVAIYRKRETTIVTGTTTMKGVNMMGVTVVPQLQLIFPVAQRSVADE